MIIDKIIKSLLTISVSLTSFSAFSASISLGSVQGIKLIADTTFIPVNIDGYQQYKEIKIKTNVTKTTNNGLNVGEYGEEILWIDCKNKAAISKFSLLHNPDGSIKKEQIHASDQPFSFVEKNEKNNPLNNLCQNSSALTSHPYLVRNLKNIEEYHSFKKVGDEKPSTMSRKEYQQTLYDMNKKISALVSHRSRLHSGRDPENPDIITTATKANLLANTEKDFELTCKKIKLLNEQKQFILDQNSFTRDLDLVPVFETLRNERIRIMKKGNSIRAQAGNVDICLY